MRPQFKVCTGPRCQKNYENRNFDARAVKEGIEHELEQAVGQARVDYSIQCLGACTLEGDEHVGPNVILKRPFGSPLRFNGIRHIREFKRKIVELLED